MDTVYPKRRKINAKTNGSKVSDFSFADDSGMILSGTLFDMIFFIIP